MKYEVADLPAGAGLCDAFAVRRIEIAGNL